VDSIRSVASNVILMGSPSWSTRLNGALTDPITGGNIAYVYHLYPNQGPATAASLDPKFGNASATLPVMFDKNWNLLSGEYEGAFIRDWLFPSASFPREVAGAGVAADIIKCKLHAPLRSDYPGFTDAQWSRLRTIFSGGVCDWSKPGVGQQPRAGTWQSFN
jgi:hypothetical protein